MSAVAASKACFLNVDLEIESASQLDSLTKELGKRVLVLYSGPGAKPKRNFLSLEVNRRPKNPDATIHAFCDLIEKLGPSGRRTWNKSRKEFNIGYELRPSERCSQFSLRADTLERIARVGADLGVTYYRGEDSDPFHKNKQHESKKL